MIIVFFGLSGVGKTFLGQLLIEKYPEFYFFDGDDILTSQMQVALQEKKQFTQQIRDEFTNLVIKKLKELSEKHQFICVSQGFYKEKNRAQLIAAFPSLKLVHVYADSFLIRTRIKERMNNFLDADFLEALSLCFDEPKKYDAVIFNTLDQKYAEDQISQLIQKWRDDP